MITFWLISLAIAGIAVSSYLLWHKITKKKLVCIIGEDCDAVVKSKYGYIFHIPNEVFGILFYLYIIGSAILFLNGIEQIGGLSSILIGKIGSFLAVGASLYLLAIQGFKLKKWCEYCVTSAAINILILASFFIH